MQEKINEAINHVRGLVEDRNNRFGQCRLEARQVEEVFVRSRQNQVAFTFLLDWCKHNRQASASFLKFPVDNTEPGAVAGKPERWQIKTIDTGRFVKFRWRPIIYTIIPPLQTNEALYAAAMSVLETAAFPLCILASRYERVANFIQVVSVDAPYACLHRLIEGQRIQNQLDKEITELNEHFAQLKFVLEREKQKENEFEKTGPQEENTLSVNINAEMKELEVKEKEMLNLMRETETATRQFWELNDVNVELFKRVSLSLLNIRDQGNTEPPFILLHSIPDKKHMVVCFRDIDLHTPDFSHRIMTLATPKQQSTYDFVWWPIFEHSHDLDKPLILCENPECEKSSGFSQNPVLLRTFEKHQGPRDKYLNSLFKKWMQELWETKYRPLIDSALEQLQNQHKEDDNSSKLEEVGPSQEARVQAQNAIIEKWEKEANKEEVAVRQKVLEQASVSLRRCTRCRSVAYCSPECQRTDWPRHKTVCLPTHS